MENIPAPTEVFLILKYSYFLEDSSIVILILKYSYFLEDSSVVILIVKYSYFLKDSSVAVSIALLPSIFQMLLFYSLQSL